MKMNTYITEIDDKWYAFGGDPLNAQVYSIGRDCPRGGKWIARWNDEGIKYVACPSPSKSAAIQKARRAGEYMCEVW